jgi:hypothetical protein
MSLPALDSRLQNTGRAPKPKSPRHEDRGLWLAGALAYSARAFAHGAKLVVCGHSHVPLIASDEAFAIFNPGSCGPQRYQLPIVFGVIDIGPGGLTMRHVDCSNGKPWLP